MNSEGKNKRRFNWKDGNTNKKFHGTREYNNEYDNRPVWDEAYSSQSPYPNSYGRPNRSWGRGRNHYNRYQHNRYNNHFQQPQVFSPPILTEPQTEPEEGVVSGPGSESERLEKILATKKRLEEALASKPSDGSHQDISFQDSSKNTDRVKTSENILEVTGVDLRLTNSDFKEIGSVVTNVAVEGEAEANDIILNTSHCISQQRSFDTACPNPPSTSSKTLRLGGWSVSAINELISSEEPVHTNLPKTGGEMYFQETRERILGNVQSSSSQQSVDSTPPRQSASNTSYQQRNKFSRVGRLYQSFLKSRLCGYTLKMRDKTIKSSGPNPFLDKSVLDNKNENDVEKESATSIGNNKILELQMPRPIPVKMEGNGGASVNTPEDIAAEEANEFCKEYSFLLTHPNYLIPPEDLEKFGLGHLSEMTRLLNERRNDGINTPPVEDQDSPLRVRSLNALNSVTEQDITFTQPVNQSHSNSMDVSTPSTNMYNSRDQEPSAGGVTSHKQHLSSGIQQHNLFNDLRNQSPISGFSFSLPQASTRSNISSDTNNVLIQTVVERVMEELKSANTNSQILSQQNQLRDTSHSSIVTNHNEPTSSVSKQPSTHLKGINDKLLTLFLIDKQIENLRQEKMKIYNEMLSSKEISSAVLNCWAQDQIQQGNFKNLIANSTVHLNTSTASEVLGVPNKLIQENNLLVPFGETFNNTCLQEAVFELAELKKEDTTINKLGGMTVEALPNSTEPHDIFNSTPVVRNMENSVPKLSVRKDLHDPNISRRLCDEENVLKDHKTEESSSELSSKSSKDKIKVKNSVLQKKEKKKNKKKKKKGTSDCVIDLVGDTSDEEMCNISQEGIVSGIDPLAPDDTCPRSLENYVLNNDRSVKSLDGSVLLPENYNATCITILHNMVVVGTKEGYLIGFSALTLKQRFCKEIHSDSIICQQKIRDYLLTGSADSTICILTMAKKQSKKISVLPIPETAPVMCLECKFNHVYGGTKNGFMVVYRFVIKATQTIEIKKVNIKKLTNSSIVALRAVKVESELLVIVASRGEQITIRNAYTGEVIRTFDWCDTVYCLKLLKKSTSVYCGTNTKSVKVVDYVTGENVHDCQVGRAVVKIEFHRNVMFTACYDGKVYFYDIKNLKLIASLVVSKGIIVNMVLFKEKMFVVDNRKELHAVPFPEELKLHFMNTNT
uniref:Uncharacterized protein n=1 Tax=Cuerna arida TaxID=1464854 RepID=A0A1B6FRB4_9HEMI